MQRRLFATTGRSVGALGLGAFKIGRNRQVKYPGGSYPLPSDEEVVRLLDTALELGIDLLDTAPAYGTSEERLGRLLGARRDRFFIVTKAGEEFDEGSRYDFSARHIEESVERSLRRLATDRLECVLLHCPRNDLDVLRSTPALDVLARLKGRGDILSFGASTHTVEGGRHALERCDAVMVTYNRNRAAERPVIDLASKLGKAVLVKKGLDSGRLAPTRENLEFIVGTAGVTSLVLGTVNPGHLAQVSAILAARP